LFICNFQGNKQYHCEVDCPRHVFPGHRRRVQSLSVLPSSFKFSISPVAWLSTAFSLMASPQHMSIFGIHISSTWIILSGYVPTGVKMNASFSQKELLYYDSRLSLTSFIPRQDQIHLIYPLTLLLMSRY
jgi:hypothetical protein